MTEICDQSGTATLFNSDCGGPPEQLRTPLGDAGNLTVILLLYRPQHRQQMQQCPCSDGNYSCASKKKSHHLMEPKDTLSCSNHRACCRLLSQIAPIHSFACYLFNSYYRTLGPPLWSSGQSFWLQIQRSRVRFPALPDFSE